jgi:oxygen-independent coproporphyrinogen III oxidase
MRSDLAQSYGQDRLPRYTSYPTAPHFSPAIGEERYRSWLKSVPVQQPASIYLHVPFCRSMCWYCGCHTSVTKRDDPIATYAAGLRTEARLVAETIGQRMPISHIHFGGGTPTIMSPETFVDLVGALRYSFFVLPDAEIAVEIDPRTLTEPMVEALGYCGVNRASLGVQSFDPAVQRTINRLQSFEQTAASVERLRRAGVGRINFDLLYGLPLQTVDSCLDTVAKCVELRPDRFSVFGYAHVPSFKKHQRKIAEDSLPNSIERHLQSETIAEALLDAGYVRIGLDHFALPGDSLAIARLTTPPTRLSVSAPAPSAACRKDLYRTPFRHATISRGSPKTGSLPPRATYSPGKIAFAPTSSSGSCATLRSICPAYPGCTAGIIDPRSSIIRGSRASSRTAP